jgi:hypothetical protein
LVQTTHISWTIEKEDGVFRGDEVDPCGCGDGVGVGVVFMSPDTEKMSGRKAETAIGSFFFHQIL